jgi:hypothetical protein
MVNNLKMEVLNVITCVGYGHAFYLKCRLDHMLSVHERGGRIICCYTIIFYMEKIFKDYGLLIMNGD